MTHLVNGSYIGYTVNNPFMTRLVPMYNLNRSYTGYTVNNPFMTRLLPIYNLNRSYKSTQLITYL